MPSRAYAQRDRRVPVRGALLALTALALAASPAAAQTRYLRATAAGRDSFLAGRVIAVTAGGPAARAGLAVGDTVLAVAGRTFADHAAFLALLAAVPATDSCALTLGRAAGRGECRVALDSLPPRLGVTVTATQLSDVNAVVVDDSLTVAVSVSEWQGISVVAASVEARGTVALAFGPDSLTVLDGSHRVLVPLDPRDLLRTRYDGRPSRRIAPPPAALAQALSDAEAEGALHPARERTARELLQDALRPARVPVGARHAGLLYFGIEHLQTPVAVRLACGGREYRFEFESVPGE